MSHWGAFAIREEDNSEHPYSTFCDPLVSGAQDMNLILSEPESMFGCKRKKLKAQEA
jgi:hypothetical protein